MGITVTPVPVPGHGEVLISVSAAGVNRPDILQRQGNYPVPPGASAVLGLEVAGIVVEVGEGVGRWRVGDRVCALTQGGGYAEFCVANSDCCLPIPAGISDIEAASLPEAMFTTWSNIWDRAALQPAETLLVHGGTSGIGVTAIQVAKALGHTVFTTAGSDAKCEVCLQLGAASAVNYRTADFVEILMRQTSSRGVDVILDMVGGDYIARNIRLLAEEGRLVYIAFLNGAKASVNFGPVLLRRLTITGSTLRPRSIAYKAGIAAKLASEVWPLLESKQIRPVVNSVFRLEEVKAAHDLMESNAHIGKIVLTTAVHAARS